MSDKLYNVGIYIRLSRDSRAYRDVESMSIENQQAMLSKFIQMMPGWIEKRTYIDNGASGGNFNRQGFQDMMSDVRQKTINLVLVQDLSRFGRNYIEAGKYLEEELPSLGCRFVALTDGIDTENGENDIMPFLNAMNDYYLRNINEKIESVLRVKAKDGQKLSGGVPFGYKRNPEEHTRLIVDEHAAKIVRRIFELRANGMGYGAISGILNKEKILPPKLYYIHRMNREVNSRSNCSEVWQQTTVKRLLENESYIGHTVSFKRKTNSYRGNRAKVRESIRVENTHSPIVSDELWETVQRIGMEAKSKYSGSREPKQSLFTKLLFCADCNAIMGYNTNIKINPKSGATEYGSYNCRTHQKSGRSICSWHRISELALKTLVLQLIKEKAKLIALDEESILQTLKQKLIATHKSGMVDIVRERKELEQQLQSLDIRLEQLYEDKVAGDISTETFMSLSSKAEKQRLELADRISSLTQTEKQSKAKQNDINCWISLIKEKSTLKEVDRDLLDSLIEKVEVGEKKIVNGVKTQDIKIYFKYVGLC